MKRGPHRLVQVKKWMMITMALMLVLSMLPAESTYAKGKSKLDRKVYGTPEPLLEPIASSPSVYDGAAGKEDGVNVMYTTAKGQPAIFQVVDIDNNKLLRSFPLTGVGESWHHEVAVDGTVYITGSNKLWAYSPVSKELTIAAEFGSQGLWALVTDPEGNAYVGTYPGGNVFKYDPSTGETRDYGRMIDAAPQEYVRSIAYHNGYIYAGTAHDKIMKVDVVTGEKQDIASTLGDTGFVYDLNVVDDKFLFARYSVSQKMYVYNLESGTWLNQSINNVNGLHVADSLDGKVYFIADRKLKSFDPYNEVLEETSITYGSGLRGADWAEFPNNPELPGKNLVTMQFGGAISIFNIQNGTVKVLDSVLKTPASVIHTIEKDHNGKIYMSSLGGGAGAVYDPASGLNQAIKIGQADSMVTSGTQMYMGTYPGANVYQYDTEAAPSDQNPKLSFQIGDEQDRVVVMTSGEGKIFMGSVSTYGKLGGALTVYNPASGSEGIQVYRNIVENQSVVGLAYLNGKIFGSTNINNGLGSVSTAEEAKMFVYDVKKGVKITEFSPKIKGVDKPEFIGRLTAGPDKLIWGAANGHIFALHPANLKVVKSKEVFTGDYNFGAWSSVPMEFSKDGLLYALFGTQLIAVDPKTMEHKDIVKAHQFEMGNDGHLYYSNFNQKTQLDRITVQDAD
ncbi:outer membrane protein assembly factor BamB family protein [Paenibacillus dakarensis]|uniref:outer membrane protein assembly factor BamB family protein n=1 Tax=Paenibacillus dakarensis TaxID=1527293 RepID=UPI0006D536A9|nr:PQQ-binding-like beta-propeller repeat protein [Paenibacillus dakarensis]